MDLGTILATHPAVVSFYDDHGVDVREVSVLQLGALGNGRESDGVERDPFRATVSYATDDATLAITVDDSLDVVDVDRSDDG